MEKKIALFNGLIFSDGDIYSAHTLLMKGGKIEGVFPGEIVPEGYEPVNVMGSNICPGLIDLQVYGAGNDLFAAELTAASLGRIEQHLLRQGCTSFMLTLATNTLDVCRQAIRVFKESKPSAALGLHLEGPFLNATKRGAHPEELIIEATLPLIADLLHDAEGVVKMMTIAPECVDPACIAALLAKDILLSAGHSMANYQEAMAGFDAGIRTTTHLWNAMSPFHHRNVGLPGATFAHPDVRASIIVDGIHVDFEAVKRSKQLLGKRLFLITDAVASCDKGIYQHVLNHDHYTLPDGTLSGSALTLLKAIQHCVEHAEIPLDEAIRMATSYPAMLIGREDIGNLHVGSKANVLVFNAGFEVQTVYFEGNKIL